MHSKLSTSMKEATLSCKFIFKSSYDWLSTIYGIWSQCSPRASSEAGTVGVTSYIKYGT